MMIPNNLNYKGEFKPIDTNNQYAIGPASIESSARENKHNNHSVQDMRAL
jgi:hypothetical protein